MNSSDQDFVNNLRSKYLLENIKDWFDVGWYRDAIRSLTPSTWADQIYRRLEIEEKLRVFECGNRGPELIKNIAIMMDSILRDPLKNTPSVYRNGNNRISGLSYTTASVFPLTLHDVKEIEFVRTSSDMPAVKPLEVLKFIAIDDFLLYEPPRQEQLNQFAHLRIDLNTSDEKIKNDFQHWLQEFRKVTPFKGAKPSIGRADFKATDYLTLAYFDLKMWSKWQQTKLSQNKLNACLLDPGLDEDLTITLATLERRTREIIYMGTYRALRAEAGLKWIDS